ncbi:unnamed protein product [Gongylonema pulchrum]|uniref:DJ-1_PfpI domain-containing protein n=1 Tax=Gongylonema pulchrum TaxID=637853 RepID=A0A183EH21_9BILA|nr:unnamed protein product [Gongylonema pulchrum]
MAPKTVMLILAEGAEEMECVIPIDILRRAGAEVTVAGLTGKNPVTCSRQVVIVPDKALSDVKKHKFDVVILPGGLKAAICAAPTALKSHGIAPGVLLTSHPGAKRELVDAGYKYSEDRVVTTSHIVTSRGPGTAFEFALKLVELLFGAKKVKEVSAPMVVKD